MNTRTEPMIDGDRTSLVGVVDVVIPCFNDGAFLLEAIGSLGKDRVNGAGIIIVNDGSDEGATLDVLAGLRMRGFQVIDQVNSGLSSARNMGWQACTAPYILFLDADNKVEPEYMERATALLDADSALSVVYSDMIEFGAREGIVKRSDINLPMLLVGNRVDACAVVRRSAIQAVGGYDQAMRDGYEDWELWIRMLSQGHRFAHIAQPLFHYRVREGSLVARADEPQKRGRIVALASCHGQGCFLM